MGHPAFTSNLMQPVYKSRRMFAARYSRISGRFKSVHAHQLRQNLFGSRDRCIDIGFGVCEIESHAPQSLRSQEMPSVEHHRPEAHVQIGILDYQFLIGMRIARDEVQHPDRSESSDTSLDAGALDGICKAASHAI